jgi:hypothetical protein
MQEDIRRLFLGTDLADLDNVAIEAVPPVIERPLREARVHRDYINVLPGLFEDTFHYFIDALRDAAELNTGKSGESSRVRDTQAME